MGIYLFVGELPDGSDPENLTEYSHEIADGSSPRIKKHIIRTRLNSGFTRDKVEYWVYLDDEILEKQSQL